ncbi:hypothetical protein BaRGS_00022892 [Batillaria attramentaria]|uniref:Uncharacterized protein n=1 Tax=Batillaria attramentaria TaxID=370345 RepID=A0ABD0KFS6_9CAEN
MTDQRPLDPCREAETIPPSSRSAGYDSTEPSGVPKVRRTFRLERRHLHTSSLISATPGSGVGSGALGMGKRIHLGDHSPCRPVSPLRRHCCMSSDWLLLATMPQPHAEYTHSSAFRNKSYT